MKPASGSETGCLAVKQETSMEHDNELLSSQQDPSFESITEEDLPNNTEGNVTENEKAKRVRGKARRPRGRKQKLKLSKWPDNLMAELPFAGTDMWKDLGFTTPKTTLKKKRKRGESGRVESEEDAYKKKKKENHRPNYFVSIPITNHKIKEGVEAVQTLVIQKDSRLSRTLIPVGSLHITLLVTHLNSEEEVSLAACAVAQMTATLQDLLRGRELVLPFSTIGHFRNEVAFVQLAEGEHVAMLTEITEAVRKTFEEKGISTGDGKAFKPHLTFMKLSRAPKLRRQGIKKLHPELYADFAQHQFGDETVSRLDLCSMLKKKTPDGYYHCQASVTFDLIQSTPRAARTSAKKAAEPDDEELVSLSKRLVEDAVLRAVQQYMEETQQNQARPKDTADNLNTNASK